MNLFKLETRNNLTAHYLTKEGLYLIAWQKAAIEALNNEIQFSYIK